MPDIEMICLANSNKNNGRCIAGLLTDGSEWIRPVSGAGELNSSAYILDNGSDVRLLDVVEINLQKPVPRSHQPENWLLGQLPWRLIARPSPDRSLIDKFLYSGPDLFGNCKKDIEQEILDKNPVGHSLVIIRPNKISFLVEHAWYDMSRRKARAQFGLNGKYYELLVKDVSWESRLLQMPDGSYSQSQMGIGEDSTTLFTISLAGPFFNGYNGKNYFRKFIAGIILL
jgi:hypothetical protein